jgi:phosphoglycolate phosphatase-like HAD superfamily hydrolase
MLRSVVCDLIGTVVDHGGNANKRLVTALLRRHQLNPRRLPLLTGDRLSAEQLFACFGRHPQSERFYAEYSATILPELPVVEGWSALRREFHRRQLLVLGATGQTSSPAQLTALKSQLYDQGLACHSYAPVADAVEIGYYPRGRVLYVGDDIEGLTEAKRAGVKTIAVLNSSAHIGLAEHSFATLSVEQQVALRRPVRQLLLRAEPDYIVKRLVDVVPLLDRFK